MYELLLTQQEKEILWSLLYSARANLAQGEQSESTKELRGIITRIMLDKLANAPYVDLSA